MRVLLALLVLVIGITCSYIFVYSVLLTATTPATVKPSRVILSNDVHNDNHGAIKTIVGSAIKSLFETLKNFECILDDNVNDHIITNNEYWQKVGDKEVYTYNAFYDNRYTYFGENFHYVRVIGMVMDKLPNGTFYCYLWYHNAKSAIVVEAEAEKIWVEQWNRNADSATFHAFLFSCPIPLKLRDSKTYPEQVSISWSLCDRVTNLLDVNKENMFARLDGKPKKKYAICVKGMDFEEDISLKLIEWIELNLILGADKIYVYTFHIHHNILKVIDYYVSIGKMDVTPLTLVGDQPNVPSQRSLYLQRALWQKRRNELVPYNDCLYRNIYKYNFVIPIDIDEVIIPVKHLTWSQVFIDFFAMQPNALKKYASFSVNNAYFFDNFKTNASFSNDPNSKLYHMMNHRIRSANFSLPGHSVKSFVATKNTKTVLNHYTLNPLYARLKPSYLMSSSDFQMNHYKKKCPRDMYSQCQSKFLKYTKTDNIISKYEKDLKSRVEKVASHLNLI